MDCFSKRYLLLTLVIFKQKKKVFKICQDIKTIVMAKFIFILWNKEKNLLFRNEISSWSNFEVKIKYKNKLREGKELTNKSDPDYL